MPSSAAHMSGPSLKTVQLCGACSWQAELRSRTEHPASPISAGLGTSRHGAKAVKKPPRTKHHSHGSSVLLDHVLPDLWHFGAIAFVPRGSALRDFFPPVTETTSLELSNRPRMIGAMPSAETAVSGRPRGWNSFSHASTPRRLDVPTRRPDSLSTLQAQHQTEAQQHCRPRRSLHQGIVALAKAPTAEEGLAFASFAAEQFHSCVL